MVVFIPGWLIALVTFPGVILHEYAHKIACEKSGLMVYEVKYFRLGNPAGYVLHEPPHTFGQALAISMFPLVVNTLAEVIVSIVLAFLDPYTRSPLGWFLVWLAISFGMHAIPSTEDAKSLYRYCKENWRVEKKAILGFPIAAIVYVLSLAKIIWIDLFYAIGVWSLVSMLFHVV
ncbi:MAG: metalloprotease family protein [Ignisphaera sp.]